MATNTLHLLKKRSFLPFFLTQFCGAFNDNVFKLAMLTLISYYLLQNQAQSEYYQALAGALFIAPFFLFSATAGELADKYNKTTIIRIIKALEVILMLIGSFALYWQNIFWMMFTLAGMGAHSTFFGPIKYAILPDHLVKEELLGATGLIDASTFIAILLGTTLGTLSIGAEGAPYFAIFITIIIAVLGLGFSLFIPSSPSSLPNLAIERKFWRTIYRMLKLTTMHAGILVPILILSWFWLLGSVILTKLPDYTKYILGADNKVFAVFLALFTLGIACGSLIINSIFRGKIVLAVVPFAMFLVSCFAFDLYWNSFPITLHPGLLSVTSFFSSSRHWHIAADLFLLAFSAGLFVVPLYTYLQMISPSIIRARIIAANNIYNALFMVLGSLAIMFLLSKQISIPQIFLILSVMNLVVIVFSWSHLNHQIIPD